MEALLKHGMTLIVAHFKGNHVSFKNTTFPYKTLSTKITLKLYLINFFN